MGLNVVDINVFYSTFTKFLYFFHVFSTFFLTLWYILNVICICGSICCTSVKELEHELLQLVSEGTRCQADAAHLTTTSRRLQQTNDSRTTTSTLLNWSTVGYRCWGQSLGVQGRAPVEVWGQRPHKLNCNVNFLLLKIRSLTSFSWRCN